MPDPSNAAAWARFAALIPDELTAAGWNLWGFSGGTTLFSDRSHLVVLRQDLDNPTGADAMGREPLRRRPCVQRSGRFGRHASLRPRRTMERRHGGAPRGAPG